jgi:DNA-binding CsgD family transcriptional regulator
MSKPGNVKPNGQWSARRARPAPDAARHDEAGERESCTRVRITEATQAEGPGKRAWSPPDRETATRLETIAEAWRLRYGFTKAQTGVFCALLASTPRELIAKREGIHVDTVTRHAREIFRKTGDDRPCDAIARALREELLKKSVKHST